MGYTLTGKDLENNAYLLNYFSMIWILLLTFPDYTRTIHMTFDLFVKLFTISIFQLKSWNHIWFKYVYDQYLLEKYFWPLLTLIWSIYSSIWKSFIIDNTSCIKVHFGNKGLGMDIYVLFGSSKVCFDYVYQIWYGKSWELFIVKLILAISYILKNASIFLGWEC